MNSGAALASWGAVFTWLRAQRAAYSRLRERPIVVAELRGGIHILGRSFQVQSPRLEAQRAAFFRFRGRPVVFAELKGAICILGRHFHLVGSSEGGIPIFIFRGRPVVVAKHRGDIRILGCRFQVQSPWLGSSESGVFQVYRAPRCV